MLKRPFMPPINILTTKNATLTTFNPHRRSSVMAAVNSQSCRYCYIDIDINNHRSNLALVRMSAAVCNGRVSQIHIKSNL